MEDKRGKFGSGKTTRRFRLLPGLFDFAARTDGDGVLVALPDGRELPVPSAALDAELSAHYRDPLRVAAERSVSHFDAGAVHLLTTASLRWLAERVDADVDVRRFRPNVLVAADGASLLEEEWVGSDVRIGTCVLHVTGPVERCVMVNNRQSELPADARILRALARLNETNLGVYARVVAPGRVAEGAQVSVAVSRAAG